ncbi:hypothetical protein BJY04DRAFT_149032 [Aspergillus karnatakaensis]|uniref:uncharacterized protein n=1 Tax=Aspergillus karnatakaensis TaxID=1810916 RepID=UPI003CCD0933
MQRHHQFNSLRRLLCVGTQSSKPESTLLSISLHPPLQSEHEEFSLFKLIYLGIRKGVTGFSLAFFQRLLCGLFVACISSCCIVSRLA